MAELYKGMGDAEQSKGGNYILPGKHIFTPQRHIIKVSQNKRKNVGKKFFIGEFITVKSTVHDVGSNRSWLVDFTKPGALGNLKNYALALFPLLNPQITVDAMNKANDDWWEQMYNWLTGPANPVLGRNIQLSAEAWSKDTEAGGKFTMVDWQPATAAA